MSQSPAAGTAPNVTVLHLALVAGLFTVLAVSAFIIFGRAGPLLEDSALVGYLLALPAVTAVVMATTLLRGRVPPRRPDQAVAEYWADGANSGPALMLWVAIESGGMLGLVGWLLSGSLVALAAGLIGLGTLIVLSPGQLAGT